MGIEVVLNTIVGDHMKRLKQVVQQAICRADLVIITGGLGPTTDDLTVQAVADVLNLPLAPDEKSLVAIRELCQKCGLKVTESIFKQAYLPESALALPNTRGTAPGALIEKDNKLIIMLPGPPVELTAMFEDSVVPVLSSRVQGGAVAKYKVFKLTGISESAVQEKIKDLGGQGNPGIAYVAKPGEIHVRIAARAANAEQACKMVADLSSKVGDRLADYIFSCDGDVLEEIVGKLLLEAGLSIGVAESCTGGMIAGRLTDIPGSSRYFMGGVVAYTDEMKNRILGVEEAVIDAYGAVSKETARAMAVGVRDRAGSDLGLAVTGVAGPDGGDLTKPVGLVYIAVADASGAFCREYRFPGARPAVRQGAASAALNMVRCYLQKKQAF